MTSGPIDRPALRALAERATPGLWQHDARPGALVGTTQRHHITCHAPTPAVVLALLDALDAAERERDAYKRAKAENDERFMLERDAARQERDRARADFKRHGTHTDDCALDASRIVPGAPCDCGYREAVERAEGRTDV